MEQLRPSQVKWHARQFPDTGAQWHKLEPGSPPASETWSRIRRWRFGKWIKTWIANGFLWSVSRSTWILSIERERRPRREEFTGHSTWVYRTGDEGAALRGCSNSKAEDPRAFPEPHCSPAANAAWESELQLPWQMCAELRDCCLPQEEWTRPWVWAGPDLSGSLQEVTLAACLLVP